MKRCKQSTRTMRRRSTVEIVSTGRKSRYAAKLDSGRMLYGGRGRLSCCAHKIEGPSPARSEHRGGMPNTLDAGGNRVFIPKRAA